jgi:hypothetical protein
MPRTSTKSATLAPPIAIASDTVSQQPGEVISKSDADMPQPESRLSQIARRAHEIYEARGGSDGKALEDWLQAEREIDDTMEEMEGGPSTHEW